MEKMPLTHEPVFCRSDLAERYARRHRKMNVIHLLEHPLQALDEIERILNPGGFVFIADLRRSRLAWFEREIASSFSLSEARQLFSASRLRSGVISSDLVWWRFQTT